MSKVWVRADDHFGHHNVLKYCQRPWTNTDQMDRALVDRHNAMVDPADTVYFLGDVTMAGAEKLQWLRKIICKMNGNKHLIFGNHDKMGHERYLDAGFLSCHTSLEIVHGGQEIVLVHDPCVAQDPSRLWLCGHLHNVAFMAPTHICVVSVELTDYRPVDLDAIVAGWRPK